MPDATIIFAAIRTFFALFGAIGRALSRKHPKLGVVWRFRLDEQGVESAGTIRLFLQNMGKAAGKDILIRLKVIKPRDAYPGYKLFFNEDIGSLESYRKPGFLETERLLKPEVYDFRLRSAIFVNPGDEAALEIARFIVFAVEKTPPSDLDHGIEWTVHCAGEQSVTNRIIVDGATLRRMLLTNLYESGRVIGYEIPSGQLPKILQEDPKGAPEK